MDELGKMYLKKLQETVNSNNPENMAIITYQAFRNSPHAKSLKKMSKKDYDQCAKESILGMEVILQELGWNKKLISQFVKRSFELADIKIPRKKKK